MPLHAAGFDGLRPAGLGATFFSNAETFSTAPRLDQHARFALVIEDMQELALATCWPSAAGPSCPAPDPNQVFLLWLRQPVTA